MTRRFAALTAAALTSAAVAVPALAQSGGGATTVSFKEVDKGSTFHYVDLPPKAKIVHGQPNKISAGDEFVITEPLADASGSIGKLHAFCKATTSAKRFDKAGFICFGDFVFTDGSTMAANLVQTSAKVQTGAITGGTGKYAGARGTFTSTGTSSGSDDVVTLQP